MSAPHRFHFERLDLRTLLSHGFGDSEVDSEFAVDKRDEIAEIEILETKEKRDSRDKEYEQEEFATSENVLDLDGDDESEEVASDDDESEEVASDDDESEEVASDDDESEEVGSDDDESEEVGSDDDESEEVGSDDDESEELDSDDDESGVVNPADSGDSGTGSNSGSGNIGSDDAQETGTLLGGSSGSSGGPVVAPASGSAKPSLGDIANSPGSTSNVGSPSSTLALRDHGAGVSAVAEDASGVVQKTAEGNESKHQQSSDRGTLLPVAGGPGTDVGVTTELVETRKNRDVAPPASRAAVGREEDTSNSNSKSLSWSGILPEWLADSMAHFESSAVLPSTADLEQLWKDLRAEGVETVLARGGTFSWLAAGAGVALLAARRRRGKAESEGRAWQELAPGLVDDAFTE